MTYNQHRLAMHDNLREFERVTGTGNIKLANNAMIKIVRSLVAMMESLPTGCGGNCQCASAAVPAPVAATTSQSKLPFTTLAPLSGTHDDLPVIAVVEPIADKVTDFQVDLEEPLAPPEPEMSETSPPVTLVPAIPETIAEETPAEELEPVSNVEPYAKRKTKK